MTNAIVQTETAAAGDLVFRAGVAQEMDGPTGEPSGGAGASVLVEVETEEVFKTDIDSRMYFGLVEFESENKSGTTAIIKLETDAAGDLEASGRRWGFGVGRVGVRGKF